MPVDHLEPLLRAACGHRRAGRLDDAAALLAQAERRFPGDPGIAVEQAWLTQARGDWPRTADRWRALREAIPDRPEGYAGGAIALRVMGDLDGAEQLVEGGMGRLPDDPMLRVERAWIAQARSDWPEAERRWAHVQAAFPDQPDGHAGLATVLRVQGRFEAAAQILQTAAARFPQATAIQAEAAWLAQCQLDWATAAARWEALRQGSPGFTEAYRQAAICLRHLGRPEDAVAVLQDGCARHPGHWPLHQARAALLLHLHRWEAARDASAALRDRWPDRPDGALGEAAALVGRNRLAEADRLLRDAAARWPADPAIALALARLPVAQEHPSAADRTEAAHRLGQVTRRFPSFADAWTAYITMLCDNGAFQAAEDAAAQAMRACPQDAAIAAAWAATAQARGEAEETVRRLRSAHQRFPADPPLARQLAQALAAAGSHDEAARCLDTIPAADRHTPGHAIAVAMLATRRGAWAAAAGRWAEAERRFPHDAAVAAAAAQARLLALDGGAALPDPAPRPWTQDEAAPQAVVGRFESLGGSPYGCEFGFVQRALALEPLGLLRWTAVPPAPLVAALAARLEGVGDPDQTELILPRSDREEYRLRDRRFGLRTHTHTTPAEVAPDVFFRRACLRQQFLARRLLQRLAGGSHVFVYRLAQREISEAELADLHGAIRAHGPGTLLCVRQSRARAEDDTVQVRAPGLLIGRIARFAVAPSGAFTGAATAHWITLCRRALEVLGQAGDAR